jgi:hypothetical protein
MENIPNELLLLIFEEVVAISYLRILGLFCAEVLPLSGLSKMEQFALRKSLFLAKREVVPVLIVQSWKNRIFWLVETIRFD